MVVKAIEVLLVLLGKQAQLALKVLKVVTAIATVKE
jgi:hypothetical protein